MTTTVTDFLLSRLQSLGVEHVFGIPGDYILPFFETLETTDGIRHVAPCNELNGGYAADGYARLRGLGAIAVTYGPGAFSLVNAVAAAYAERSPLVVISGGPPLADYQTQPLRHHILPGKYDASIGIFKEVTVGARVLDDPDRAAEHIDAMLRLCLQESRPVYIEFPQDLQRHPVATIPEWTCPPATGDAAQTAAALDRLTERLLGSERCVLLIGHEVQAFDLRDDVRELVDRTGVNFASVFSGRPDFMEDHPRCIGMYHGAGSLEPIRAFVEDADTVIWLGAVASDFNKGGGTAKLSTEQEIQIFDDQVIIDGESFESVRLRDVVTSLLEALPTGHWADVESPTLGYQYLPNRDQEVDAPDEITNERLLQQIANFLGERDIILGDAGPSISMSYMQIPAGARFIVSGYWASIGGGFGMTLGASIGAAADQRVLAFEGDGSFQMTAQELSTMVRYNKTPIIFLLNNRGYTAERLIHDGEFNDIQNWQYWRLPEVYGGVAGCEVRTEGDLQEALERAANHTGPGPLMIEVHLDPLDVSEAFARMSAGLRSR
ncbi:MAG: thiamine pyrophosphate-binding protein [Gammaproteobacteria bacterium]|nr:thiamine pyrophosphate-binding protein [Gammaproteobacteria bacterium]